MTICPRPQPSALVKFTEMSSPVIIPRSDHPISRQHIDADALKVLYRLRQFNHIAYLVGGSVRDLLLGRTPKDFDIGTSAHPYQVKRLFRNCWIIGRRFRLAHVKFGTKVIEVATFRRQIPAGTEEEPVVVPPVPTPPSEAVDDLDLLVHHDNTFGTPEEDAFRRDFTLNALFYDIETRSIIDYVGGLEDIRAGVIRCIGVPEDRFQEDPVRMLRAVAFAARLDFAIDAPILRAIERYHGELARSAPARLMEEIYKVLRAGFAEKAFRMLVDTGLLAAIAPEVPGRISPTFWQSLAAIDSYRRAFKRNPEALGNAILLGSLLIPLGLLDQHHGRTKELGARFGILPLARRDVEYSAADSDAAAASARSKCVATAQARDHSSQRLSCRPDMARASWQCPGYRRILARAAGNCRRTDARHDAAHRGGIAASTKAAASQEKALSNA